MARASMFRDFLPYLNLFRDFYRFWLFCCDRLTEIFYLVISRSRENPYSKFASLKITVANLKSIKAFPTFYCIYQDLVNLVELHLLSRYIT